MYQIPEEAFKKIMKIWLTSQQLNVEKMTQCIININTVFFFRNQITRAQTSAVSTKFIFGDQIREKTYSNKETLDLNAVFGV